MFVLLYYPPIIIISEVRLFHHLRGGPTQRRLCLVWTVRTVQTTQAEARVIRKNTSDRKV